MFDFAGFFTFSGFWGCFWGVYDEEGQKLKIKIAKRISATIITFGFKERGIEALDATFS